MMICVRGVISVRKLDNRSLRRVNMREYRGSFELRYSLEFGADIFSQMPALPPNFRIDNGDYRLFLVRERVRC
jgi:hypothetical protein